MVTPPCCFSFLFLLWFFGVVFFFYEPIGKWIFFLELLSNVTPSGLALTGSVLVAEELSVLRDTSPMMSVPCHVVGDQNCPQCLTLWALVWCGALYIPCASQSHYVTITGEINHTMNSFCYSGPKLNDPLYSKAISITRHWGRHSLFFCEELIAIKSTFVDHWQAIVEKGL